ITNRRFGTPTCTAAKPTPGAAYIVSNILLTNFSRSSSKSVTGSAGVSSTGAGHFTISSNAILFPVPIPPARGQLDSTTNADRWETESVPSRGSGWVASDGTLLQVLTGDPSATARWY